MQSIKKILENNYNFKNIFVKKLYGYDNLNYLIETNGVKYILKIYQPNTISYSLFEAENKVMIFLSEKEKNIFPVPIKNKLGKYVYEQKLDGEKKVFRLLTFIEGSLFIDCKSDDLLFESFGSFVANMSSHLLLLQNKFYENHVSEWDVNNALLSKKHLKYIRNNEDRNVVEYFFEQFEKHAVPVLPSLRKSLIHNDANNQNVVVNGGKVTGIFDFGDVVYSALINELAVSISYTIVEQENPLQMAATFVKSYNKILKLTQKEIDILYYIIPALLCISVCHSSYNKTLFPDNEYITVYQKPALDLLKEWKKIEPEYAKKIFTQAIN